MAAVTTRQYLHTHKDGDDSVRGKSAPISNPHPPPSPPMTETEAEIETDTDRELDSASFPPSMSSPPEPIKTKATTDLPAESNLSSFEQDSDGQTLRQGNNTTDTEDRHSRGRTQNQTPSPKTLPVASPPFWAARNSQDSPAAYGRTAPSASAESLTLAGLGITMQDNENSSIDERGSACWAKSVEVNSYVIVNSSATNIGAFVVWNIRVETLNVNISCTRTLERKRWRRLTFPGDAGKLYGHSKTVLRVRRSALAANAHVPWF